VAIRIKKKELIILIALTTAIFSIAIVFYYKDVFLLGCETSNDEEYNFSDENIYLAFPPGFYTTNMSYLNLHIDSEGVLWATYYNGTHRLWANTTLTINTDADWTTKKPG